MKYSLNILDRTLKYFPPKIFCTVLIIKMYLLPLTNINSYNHVYIPSWLYKNLLQKENQYNTISSWNPFRKHKPPAETREHELIYNWLLSVYLEDNILKKGSNLVIINLSCILLIVVLEVIIIHNINLNKLNSLSF